MDQEQKKVLATQDDIQEIKKEVYEHGKILNEVHMALIGSPLGKDGGIVRRLEQCEIEAEELRRAIDKVALASQKSTTYIRIIWGMGGAIITGACTLIFYLFIKK